jgi:hypothetical protein
MFAKSAKHFLDVLLVFFEVVRENENIVEVDQHTLVEEVTENVIHKMLKSSRSVREA